MTNHPQAVTADTITDEQLREARDMAVARFERGVETRDDREIVRLYKLAMFPHMAMSMLSAEDHAEVRAARARCAEILNARRSK